MRDALIAVAVTGSVYGILLAYRTDYVGHYLAGFGGTLLLLTLPLAAVDRAGWSVVGIVLVAIGLGWVTEATIYRLAIFDPVDFVNQSLGACIAGAVVIDRRRSIPGAAVVFVLGLLSLWAGYWYALA